MSIAYASGSKESGILAFTVTEARWPADTLNVASAIWFAAGRLMLVCVPLARPPAKPTFAAR
jgi:hypothetical protein